MSATIRDVAKKAGVSPSTVSKALNESSAVSADTMKKIQQAVKVLNYQPNARARSFATRATMHIVFLADFPYDAAFVNPHLFEIMRGVQHSLDKKGYALIMKQADAKSAYAYTETAAAQHQVDGFIFHACGNCQRNFKNGTVNSQRKEEKDYKFCNPPDFCAFRST